MKYGHQHSNILTPPLSQLAFGINWWFILTVLKIAVSKLKIVFYSLQWLLGWDNSARSKVWFFRLNLLWPLFALNELLLKYRMCNTVQGCELPGNELISCINTKVLLERNLQPEASTIVQHRCANRTCGCKHNLPANLGKV